MIPLDQILAATEAVQKAVACDPDLKDLDLGDCLSAKADRAVFQAKLKGKDLILKIHMGDTAQEMATAQAAELAHQAPRMSKGRYRVPKLIYASETTPLVLMSRAGGLRTDKALKQDKISRSDLLHEAGRWLGTYVRDRRQTDPFGGGFWIQKRFDELGDIPDPKDKARMIGLINAMAADRFFLKGQPITRARSHGDFVPINLMVDDGMIWGVDIQNRRHLALAKDIARFLVYLEFSDPAATGPWRWGLSKADCDALLGDGDLIALDEAEALLPFFIAEELSGRLVPEAPHPRHLGNLRTAIDRYLSAA